MQFKRLNWNLSIADHRRKTASMPYPPNDRRTLSKEGKFEKEYRKDNQQEQQSAVARKGHLMKVISRPYTKYTVFHKNGDAILVVISLSNLNRFLPNIHQFNFFTGELSDKPLLIRLLTNPPHLKYVTTVHCNLSLIATLVCDCRSFSNINVSQGTGSGKERVY